MLENFNDYLSLIVLIIFAIAGLRLFSGALSFHDKKDDYKRYSILFDYTENEDE